VGCGWEIDMRRTRFVALSCIAAGLTFAGSARAEKICTASAPDPAVTVSLHVTDDGMVEDGEVHWAVPSDRPDLPSMVHIVYPLSGDHAGSRPYQVITLNAVTGDEIIRSPTASIEIVVDGMEMAVRSWDLYAQAVEQLTQRPPPQGLSKASFLGAVPFSSTYQDGKRDIDSSAALMKIADGAHTLEVRLLGQDGMAMQDHTYELFNMPAPASSDVKSALEASQKMAQQDLARCRAYE
jgi:hypothetical protein